MKCNERVWEGFHYHQCSRNEWKDGFCKQHHPETVKERKKKSQEKWDEKMEKSPYVLLAKADRRIAELEAELAEYRCIEQEDRLS